MKGKEHTDPWSLDELAMVDGHPFAYTRDGDDMIVRFPGGGSATPAQLAAGGCDFRYPRRARGWPS